MWVVYVFSRVYVCINAWWVFVCKCVYEHAFSEPDKPKRRWTPHQNDQSGRLHWSRESVWVLKLIILEGTSKGVQHDRGNHNEALIQDPHSAPAWEQPLNPARAKIRASIRGKNYKPLRSECKCRLLFLWRGGVVAVGCAQRVPLFFLSFLLSLSFFISSFSLCLPRYLKRLSFAPNLRLPLTFRLDGDGYDSVR